MVTSSVQSSLARTPTWLASVICFLLNASPFLMSYRNEAYGAALAGSSCRFHDHSKSRALSGELSDQRLSLRRVNVHTDPSLLPSTLVAIHGTATKSALNTIRPAKSEGTPVQYRSLLKSWLAGSFCHQPPPPSRKDCSLASFSPGPGFDGFAA